MQQTAAFPGSRPSAVRLLGAFVVLSASAAAQSVFWDTNGSTSGSSASTIATGTWDAGSARWNAASDGTGSTAAWQAGDTAVFSAGTNATGAYTVTISGTQTVGGLTFNLGDVSFHAGWTLHRAGPNSTTKARDVHTIIYMDEDMRLAAPKNSNQQNDWDHWAPGIQIGDIMASAVESLRQEISGILGVIEPQDEVLVRIESPGGVVPGYGLAASQLARIRQAGVPRTLGVDKVAASGGYLIACLGQDRKSGV